MSSLATITSTYGLNWNNNGNGPFAVGSNLYQLCANPGSPIQLFMSTDGGSTWNVQDAAHAPTARIVGTSFCYDGISTFWIVYPTTTDFWAVISFDTTTNLYGLITVTTNPSAANLGYVIFRQSDAQLVFISNDGTQIAAFLFQTLTLTWGAFIEVGPLPVAGAQVLGAFAGLTDLTYIVMYGESSGNLQIQSFSGSGVVGVLQTIDTGTSDAVNNAAIAVNSTTVMIALAPFNTGGLGNVLHVLEAPLLTLVFTLQTIITPGSEIKWLTGVAQGLALVVIVATDTGIYMYRDFGSGFGSEITLYTSATVIQYLTSNLVSGSPGIGVVLDQSPPVSYLFISAATNSAVLAGFGGGVVLPSSTIGTLCSYARQVRAKGRSLTPMVIGNNITFGKVH
jgi:hypothetical protein